MDKLTGKVAIVVGASAGIGRTTAAMMAAEGAQVVAAARSADLLNELVDHIGAAGGEAIACPTDMANEEQVKALMETTVAAYGGIDVLVLVAAAHDANATGTDYKHDVGTLPTEVWDRIYQVMVRGTALCIKHALPHMLERGRGSIINFSSSGAVNGSVNLSAYNCANAARESLTRHVAAAYGKRGIRSNAISPGMTLTERSDGQRSDAWVAGFMRNIPSLRLGETADLAHAAVFLASEDSEYVQGQVLRVDGGVSAVGATYGDAWAIGRQHLLAEEGS
jgi:NAD(P)-dependent dehydrogenase (short-subunit alcohol dehydrogenase family)